MIILRLAFISVYHVRFVVYFLHCALASGAVYCNRSCLCVCVFVCGGRARASGRCPNLTTASARAVFASLWALFYFILFYFLFGT